VLVIAAGCSLGDDEETRAPPPPPPPAGPPTAYASDFWRPVLSSSCGDRLERPPRKGGIHLYFSCEPARAGPLVNAAAARRLRADEETPEDALDALLAGPTRAERRAGFYSNFGPKTRDIPFSVSVDEDSGLATVDLDPEIKDVPFAFVSVQETAQITSTIGQFPGVERVEIRIGGRPLCEVLAEC
jgi:spore germination protein GerM